MRTWSYVFGSAATALLFVACSGSSDIAIPRSLDDAGYNLVDSGGQPPVDDSGIVCAPCESPPPNADCTGTGRCGCAPYTCPDAGNGPVDGGDDATVDDSCVWSPTANPCPAGKYCKAEGNGCGKGKCEAIPATEANNRAPVCGCDGITYWNVSVAAKRGMSVGKDNGACGQQERVVCGGIAGPNCPSNAKCNYRVGNQEDCKAKDDTGVCWMTPQTCPAASVINRGVACTGGACQNECELINAQASWHTQPLPLCL